jgi:hypothetical protein
LKENWEHIVSTPYTALCSNKESPSFQADVEQMIAEGTIPAVKRDHEGKEVPYSYQFFITEEPKDLIHGLGFAQYNTVKGVCAGAALAVSAPFLDAVEKYNQTDEEGQKGGFEGAVQGFGAGAARGLVGGFMLAGSGLAYGAINTVKGLGSLNNITKGAALAEEAKSDFDRLYEDPIMSVVLQKGQGLEDFIVEEEVRKKKEAEEKAAFEEAKAEWYRVHPGEVHPSDKVPEFPVDLTSWVPAVSTLNPFASCSDITAAGGGVFVVGEDQFTKTTHASDEVASQ